MLSKTVVFHCQATALPGKLCQLAKEQFFYSATKPLFKKLEQLSHRSGVSRGQAFEDWLTAMVCALAAETKEDEYMAMIDRHKRGETGRRGADLMPQMFAELVDAMSREDVDILGDRCDRFKFADTKITRSSDEGRFNNGMC